MYDPSHERMIRQGPFKIEFLISRPIPLSISGLALKLFLSFNLPLPLTPPSIMMPAPRLLFLWPAWAKTSAEASYIPHTALRCARAQRRMRAYHPSRRIQQAPNAGGISSARPEHAASSPSAPSSSSSTGGSAGFSGTDPMLDSGEAVPLRPPHKPLATPEEKPKESILETVPDPASQKDAKEQGTGSSKEHPADEKGSKAYDDHAPPPKAPHIEPPPYIHHFDTYGLVKRLTDGGWDQKQAITVMKSMRLMLADNTDLAKDALVSKSNLENEAYLFKAACAELKTEVTTRRKSEQEKMRTERTQLQHEVDILSQRLGQETAHLKDELKGMFDDRKMTVRNEQRDVESKVSQLNYRITVNLQADAKSEVEGLRMIMTRRVILTLGIVVGMVLGSLKLAADSARDAEKAGKASGATGLGVVGFDGVGGGGGGGGGSGQNFGAGGNGATGEIGQIREGGDPSLISLG